MLQSLHFNIEAAENIGHDRIINGYKTEIKFSCASCRNYKWRFTFNHIGLGKDWKRIIFCGINGDLEEKIVWFCKEDIPTLIADGVLRHQQGGVEGGMDDYISSNSYSTLLLNHPLAKTLEVF